MYVLRESYIKMYAYKNPRKSIGFRLFSSGAVSIGNNSWQRTFLFL